ncbi:MAG TPA: acyl-CoA dehydrogenase family protein [Acidimicrobiales bacterium]|nr:acyl-CoA dehydrogenase family protein [Acidimicrobiales bacterium]
MSDLAEFHDELRSVARDLLAPASPLVTGGEPGRVDLSQLAKAGWLGLDVPAAYGGSGATFAEVAVVLEEIGRSAAATPMLGAVLAVGALGSVEPSTARDQLLTAVAEGEVRATVAVAAGDEGLGARPGCAIERDGGSVRLSGRVRFVPDAPEAERVLVVADDPSSGPVLVEATPGVHVEVRPLPVVDATRSLGEVVATGAAVEPTRIWPLAAGLGPLADRAALAIAADAVGVAGAALDATVAYAAERRQFGRPIGSFQAVKHACADVTVGLTISRRLVADAVAAVAGGSPDVGVAVSMAKAHAVETAVAATGSALQLHGGIGYTWEHGLHVFVKRAALDRSLFGSPAAHRARLARRYGATAS